MVLAYQELLRDHAVIFEIMCTVPSDLFIIASLQILTSGGVTHAIFLEETKLIKWSIKLGFRTGRMPHLLRARIQASLKQ